MDPVYGAFLNFNVNEESFGDYAFASLSVALAIG
jgi:hypothetical protein